MPSDNNNIINRPFADLQERMAEVERLDRTDDITNIRTSFDFNLCYIPRFTL